MNICVIGTGYVGLVAGTCFAESGNDVICVDIDKKKIDALQAGRIPIYEPGLEELVKRNTAEGRLAFTTDLKEAVAKSLVCFIAVGTPQSESGAANMEYVHTAARQIGEAMDGYRIVVCKSTVPVGTAAEVKAILTESAKHPFAVISNPEFMKEGAALEDFLKPDRVVIGGEDERAMEAMRDLYSPFVRGGAPIISMDNPSAEMTKYAANALLAVKISFINEIANLCESVGADVSMVRKGIGTDSRLGMHFLYPGLGYGGSCFPKDVRAIMHTAEKAGMQLSILNSVDDVNNRQKRRLFDKLSAHFKGDLKGRTFGVWGLAFKPRTDDMREAPAIGLIEALLEAGCTVHVHDPEAMEVARGVFGDRVTYHAKNYDALKDADALLVVTEWNEFRHPDFDRIKGLLKQPLIFDGRNLWEPAEMAKQGFTYYPIGRKPVIAAS